MTTTLTHATQTEPAYFALCGKETVAWADTLDELIADVEAIHEQGESVALWKMPALLVGYFSPTGEIVELCYREPNPCERLARE